jgi:hypothetical protein
MVLLNPKWFVAITSCLTWKLEVAQGHQEHTKDHHDKANHFEIQT